MNKAQLIDAIAFGSNLTKADSGKALGALTGAVRKALKNGERVSIPGFGSFSITERKARKGRNPRTGETIQIAAKSVVKFKASKVYLP